MFLLNFSRLHCILTSNVAGENLGVERLNKGSFNSAQPILTLKKPER